MTSTLTRPLQSQLPPRNHMDDLELQQLVRSIQASPNRQDRVVRKQINLLISEVSHRLQGARGFWISQYSGVQDIESIVDLVINDIFDTLVGKSGKINSYNPDRAFMPWINAILRNRVIDAYRQYLTYHSHYHPISMDLRISEDSPTAIAEILVHHHIEEVEHAEALDLEMTDRAIELRRFIENDPEGHLSSTHIRNRPDVTFKQILLMRLVPMKWQDIADSFNISAHSAINVFHDRNLRKYNSYFRKYLYECWY